MGSIDTRYNFVINVLSWGDRGDLGVVAGVNLLSPDSVPSTFRMVGSHTPQAGEGRWRFRTGISAAKQPAALAS